MGRKPWDPDPDNRPGREPPEPDRPSRWIPDDDKNAEEIDFDRPIPGDDDGEDGA